MDPKQQQFWVQVVASFIFGAVLVVFLWKAFFDKPQPETHEAASIRKYRMQMGILRVMASLCAGLFGIFVSGAVVLALNQQTPKGQITIQAAAGFALFVLVFWWNPFRIRETKEVRGTTDTQNTGVKKGGVSFSLVDGMPLAQALETAARFFKISIHTAGFTPEALETPMQGSQVDAQDYKELLERFRGHTGDQSKVPAYTVAVEGRSYTLQVNPGPN